MSNVFGNKSSAFIERSLFATLSFLKESVFADEYALKKGFLQSIDPRLKVIMCVMLLVAVVCTKDTTLLLFMYIACLCLAVISGITLLFFIQRTWIFIPLFSIFIVFPAIFQIVAPGDLFFTLRIPGIALVVTRQGVANALLFVSRILVSVSLVVLLNLTTRHTVLLKVLRIFKVPQLFVMTLGMCYRYIFLLIVVIEDMFLAIKSRAGFSLHYKQGQEIMGRNIAALWQRSFELTTEVHSAMLSRGYRGEPYQMSEFKARLRDWVWLSCVTLVSLFMIYIAVTKK
ncbi:MAG: cobalt ECF transporter T component CbiQ [Candidatus Omnitrophica bacterium]|nr:cobalt ECF transporter T component CbiQ [Candidatus Omnitrophota bacterium]